MAKITAVTNGLQGILARQQINDAIKSAETDSSLTGDGNVGTELSAATALAGKAPAWLAAVIVQSASDFPAPSGGEITLVANTSYVIDGVINIADTIVPALNNSITSFSFNTHELNYTGVGSMFKGRDTGISISDVSLRCANGTLNDWEDIATPQSSVVEYDSVNIREVKHIGLSTNIKQLRYFTSVFEDIKTTGHTLSGLIKQIVSIDTDFVNNSATPTFDLGSATTDSFWMINYQADLNNASGSHISGLTASGNINVGGLGHVVLGLYLGAGTPIVGITVDDVRWNFKDNNIIPETKPSALLSTSDNALETAIATQGVPVKVNAVWVDEISSQFIVDSTGRATFKGERDISIPIDLSLGLKSVSGNIDVSCSIAIDGTVVTTGIPVSIGSTKPASTVATWEHNFTKDNFVEAFVTNLDGTQNLIVTDAILRAS